MCGRYASFRRDQEIADAFDVTDVVGEELPPSWNVAPTHDVRVVLERTPRGSEAPGDSPPEARGQRAPGDSPPEARGQRAPGDSTPEARGQQAPADSPPEAPGDRVKAPGRQGEHPAPAEVGSRRDGGPSRPAAARQLRTVRWGLIPSWAKDPAIGSRLINARSESITEKPAFKAAASRRRCIIPADGYYEWQKTPEGKQPYFLHGDGPLAFAGLYELWPDPNLPEDHPMRWRWTMTILTTRAADELGHIHDRTPLLVPPDLLDAWLDPRLTDPREVRDLVAAIPEPHLRPRPVGKAVGRVSNNGPELIEPVEL